MPDMWSRGASLGVPAGDEEEDRPKVASDLDSTLELTVISASNSNYRPPVFSLASHNQSFNIASCLVASSVNILHN